MSSPELLRFFQLVHPFQLLSESELEELITVTDIGYYKRGELLFSPDELPNRLFLILKGRVFEVGKGEETLSIYNEYESFDGKALLSNSCENRFLVDEELICYEIPKESFLKLVETHRSFQNHFVKSFAKKIDGVREKERSGALSSFMLAKVSDIFLHQATVVVPETSILEALQKREESKTSAIIVKEGENLSIITDTNLRRDVLLAQKPLTDPVREIAVSPVETISHNDFLFNGLISLVRNDVKRLPVLKGGEIIGILEQMDILSHFSNHSHLIVVQIEKAKTESELKSISGSLVSLIRSLFEKGVKVRHSAKLISELNKKIYYKLASLIFPEYLHSQISLVVMGSEGRREQILKTDQDNGIILKDESYRNKVLQYSKLFTEKLIEMGYPPCDGDIMISNPYWVDTVENFKRRITQFVETPKPEALMELAIIFDGEVVFGEREGLKDIKNHIISEMNRNSFAMDSFAGATLSFDTPLSLFKNFVIDSQHQNELDIKKGGIFSIVHGVRALALEHSVSNTNTFGRLKELNNSGVLSREFASEVIEAFDTLLTIRLEARLKKMEKESEVDNYINPKELSNIQRELLKDSFKIVDRFKKFISHHFHLERIS
jgi:CBS domain-containing protein